MLEEKFATLNAEANLLIDNATRSMIIALNDNARLNQKLGENMKTIEFSKNLLVVSWFTTALLISLRLLGW